MKPALIILAILAFIWAADCYVGNFIEKNTQEMMPHIAQAKTALQEGDLDEAARQLKEMKQKWDEGERKWEAMVNHNESERVETILTRLESMITAGTPELILPELNELEFFFTHMNDMQKLRLENIF